MFCFTKSHSAATCSSPTRISFKDCEERDLLEAAEMSVSQLRHYGQPHASISYIACKATVWPYTVESPAALVSAAHECRTMVILWNKYMQLSPSYISNKCYNTITAPAWNSLFQNTNTAWWKPVVWYAVCTYVCMYVRMYVCMYVCMYVSMYACT